MSHQAPDSEIPPPEPKVQGIVYHSPTIPRSTLINIVGALIPGVLLLLTVPLYLHRIGEARYGVLAIVWILLGYFGAFDLGLGRAVANGIAKLQNATGEERSLLFWTAFLTSEVFGIIGAIILYLSGGWIFSHIFSIVQDFQAEALGSMFWIALALPLATGISVLAGTLEGRQSFISLNIGQIVGLILYQILPLSAAFLGWVTLPHLIAAAIVGRGLGGIVLFFYCSRILPITRAPGFNMEKMGTLLRYGGFITISSIVGPLLTLFDRFVIGAKLGMVAVATYSVPYKLVNYTAILPLSLSTALFPRFSMVPPREAHILMTKALKAIVSIMTPLIILFTILLHPFLVLWVGADFAEKASPVGILLLAGIWINAIAYSPYSYLQARGRPDLTAKFHLLELLPYMAVLWIFVEKAGISGAALAWSIRVGIDAVLLFWAGKVGSSFIRMLVLPGLLTISTAIVALSFVHHSKWFYVIESIVFAISVLWSYRIASSEWRLWFENMFSKMANRTPAKESFSEFPAVQDEGTVARIEPRAGREVPGMQIDES